MNEMNNTKEVEKQYNNTSKFNKRQSFHDKYSTNKYGFRNWLFDKYEVKEGIKILELGAGNGLLWEEKYEKLPANVTLVLSDITDGMCDLLRKIQKKYPNIQVKKIDIQDIPYANEMFDIVIANHMLYHVTDVEKAIREVYRVLKKGGIFYASTLGTEGLQKYLHNRLKEFDKKLDLFAIDKWSFTLQSGGSLLNTYFRKVEMFDYPDSIEIPDEHILVEWIFTSVIMQNMDKTQFKDLPKHFRKYKDELGILHIPKKIGLFISKK